MVGRCLILINKDQQMDMVWHNHKLNIISIGKVVRQCSDVFF